MDEDSPWHDEPSRSSSHTNLPASAANAESAAAAAASAETAVAASATPTSQPAATEAGTTAATADTDAASSAPRAAPTKTVARRGGRGPRQPRRVQLESTKLESSENGMGPLGPLGEEANASSEPPEPPVKEQTMPFRGSRPTTAGSSMSNSMVESADFTESGQFAGGRSRVGPPPVAPPPPSSAADPIRRQGEPSVSIEQAAKPSFDISVGDPHKVGDLTSSHIVYQVHTKTTSKGYRNPEFTVSRRYRDFLWLYNTLHNNNPGIVVPPPPEKQAMGRFDTNFVESRRQALERMLNKTAAHPTLQHDGDLKLFLESDSFNVDIKHREHREIGLGESKGMLASLGIGGNATSKFVEHDDWFHDRSIYLDALENQLKALQKSLDTVIGQRKALAEAAGDFSQSLNQLSLVEISPALSTPLDGLSEIQLRIQELYSRQAQQDVLTLGVTVDEYIRLIGSIKMAFQMRQKSYHSWHSAEQELMKRRSTQEKLQRSGRTQQDRLNQLQADVAEGERRCHQARLQFEEMGRLMRAELERFEREKVEDFKSGVETFLEGAVEAQKELIEIWETFLMQIDAEDDDQPFLKPQIMQTEPLVPSKQQQQQNEQSRAAAAAAGAGTVGDSAGGEGALGNSNHSNNNHEDDEGGDVDDDASSHHEAAARVAAALEEERGHNDDEEEEDE